MKIASKLVALLALILLAPVLFGQQAAPPTPPAIAAPQLSEAEQLKIENIRLKAALAQSQSQQLQQQQKELQAEYVQLVEAIAAAHPGYRLDQQTGGLVAVK